MVVLEKRIETGWTGRLLRAERDPSKPKVPWVHKTQPGSSIHGTRDEIESKLERKIKTLRNEND